MKKLLATILILALVPAAAFADLPDISGLSYDELVQLKDQINLAIWNCQEWKEVEVPIGVWEIGKDIPAGTWKITPLENSFITVWYGDVLNETKTGAGMGWDGINGYSKCLSTKKNKDGTWRDINDPHYVELLMKEGWFFTNGGPVIFTPSDGKPDLDFN